MNLRRKSILAAILMYFLSLLFSACAPKQMTKVVYIPAGVDTTIAALADSVARDLFVDWKNEQLSKRLTDSASVMFKLSDSLLAALQADTASGNRVSSEDSIAALKKLREVGSEMAPIKKINANKKLSIADKRAKIQERLEAAKPLLEQAITLDPFNRSARNVLAQVYQNLGILFQQKSYWGKSIEVLSKLVLMDQSQHSLFARLGSAYLQLNNWPRSLENYKIAEDLLRQSAIYKVPKSVALTDSAIAAAIDSSRLFVYVVQQAICTMRLYREKETFKLLEKGMQIAQNKTHKRIVQQYFDWAMWDDGNLETADRRDTLFTWARQKKYAAAARGMEELIPNLRAKRAAQEIKWRLATIRYKRLSMEESALDLMKEIVDFYKNDSTGIELAKRDSMLAKYQDNYGVMCYNVGTKWRSEKRDKVKALKYFMQSANIPWREQAKAWLAVAQLSIQKPEYAEAAARKAMALESQLNNEDYAKTMALLINSLRLQRKMTEANTLYKKWQELTRK